MYTDASYYPAKLKVRVQLRHCIQHRRNYIWRCMSLSRRQIANGRCRISRLNCTVTLILSINRQWSFNGVCRWLYPVCLSVCMYVIQPLSGWTHRNAEFRGEKKAVVCLWHGDMQLRSWISKKGHDVVCLSVSMYVCMEVSIIDYLACKKTKFDVGVQLGWVIFCK